MIITVTNPIWGITFQYQTAVRPNPGDNLAIVRSHIMSNIEEASLLIGDEFRVTKVDGAAVEIKDLDSGV